MMTEKENSTQSVPPTKPESEKNVDGETKPDEDKTSKLENEFKNVEGDVLTKEREKLEKLRTTVEGKITEYKELVGKAEEQGKALQQVEMSEEEKITASAKEMLKGTGLEDRL